MALTKRQKEILRDLEISGKRWNRPMDIGAWDSSYHSAVLNQLVKKGLVERRGRPTFRNIYLHRQKPASYEYRAKSWFEIN